MTFCIVHFPGRGTIFFLSAVACFRYFVVVFVDDLAVVRLYNCLHIVHAAVTEF